VRADFHPDYRPDVDGLRAVAILAVVFYHIFPTVLTGGFVGVDVFFVISGFLISRIIFKGIKAEKFSFLQFYSNRIRRIFPALLLMLVASYICGWFILLPDDFKVIGRHTLAGLAFVQNFVLMREAGYFDTASELKPLMHLWSLAIEEQFYLIYPVLLVAMTRMKRSWLVGLASIAFISFAINVYDIHTDVVRSFFSPESRFWEMSFGGMLAWFSGRGLTYETTAVKSRLLRKSIASACGLFFILVAAVLFDHATPFPGWFALLPVSGAVLLIYAGPLSIVNRFVLSNRVMVGIGLISYPLYLWHWPLLAYVRIFESKAPSLEVRIVVLLLSFLFAWLTYRFLESKLKQIANKNRVVQILVGVAVVVAAIGFMTDRQDGFEFRSVADSKRSILQNLKWPWETSNCDVKFKISPCLQSSEHPGILVLGDSHSNHLYPGLSSIAPSGVFAAGACAPIEGVSIRVQKNQERHPCATVDTLKQGLELLEQAPSAKTVLLAGFWRPALSGEILNQREREMWGRVHLESKYPEEKDLPNETLVLNGLVRSVQKLREAHRRVVVLRDTFDLADELPEFCRLQSRSMPNDCSISRSEVLQRRRPEDKLVAALTEKFPDLEVVDPIDLFCDADRCFLMRGGHLYYRDQHHLSAEGSRALAEILLPILKR
jgi:peptidoglycan/LPS O-acetylase OafA/YrhL